MGNEYKYNGKELQEKEFSDGNGLELYDYGARMMDAQLGRFFSKDRLAEKYFNLTPYHYGANNPILYIDINGDSLNVANSDRQNFMEDLWVIFGDKANNFQFNANGNLIYVGNKRKDFSGDEKTLFLGLDKITSDKNNDTYLTCQEKGEGITINGKTIRPEENGGGVTLLTITTKNL